MHGQSKVFEGTTVYEFIKRKVEEEYNIKICILRCEIGCEGEHKDMKRFCLGTCDGDIKEDK